MPSNHLILCHPLLLPPSLFPSIRVFSNESALCIRWLKYWNFSFSISPSNEYSGQISFRMDWLDLLAVQGTLKSFFQYCNSKSVLQHSAFWGFPDSSVSKESACNAGDQDSIPGVGKIPLEKGMATCSSILAWRIPWMEESGRLYIPWDRKEWNTTSN